MPNKRGPGADGGGAGTNGDTPTPIDTAWFRQVIEGRKTSARQLAIRMSLDPAAMSLMLRGMRKMSVVEAGEMAELLGQPIEEVIKRAGGVVSSGLRTPAQIAAMGGAKLGPRAVGSVGGADSDVVAGHMAVAGGAVEVAGWIDRGGVIHKERPLGPTVVERPPGVPTGSVALRLQSGDLWDGWLVFYRPNGAGVGAEAVGQLCVIECEDGAVKLRFVQRGYEAGKWSIGGGLWPREDGVVLKSAAPVLWMKQR